MTALLHAIITGIENDRIIDNISIWKKNMKYEKKLDIWNSDNGEYSIELSTRYPNPFDSSILDWKTFRMRNEYADYIKNGKMCITVLSTPKPIPLDVFDNMSNYHYDPDLYFPIQEQKGKTNYFYWGKSNDIDRLKCIIQCFSGFKKNVRWYSIDYVNIFGNFSNKPKLEY